jgi:hypothetical protein
MQCRKDVRQMNDLQNIPKPGEFYRHFKGNLYQILTLATHTETGETLVIYQALYGKFQVFARPLTMFLKDTEDGKKRFYRADMGEQEIMPEETVFLKNGKKDSGNAYSDMAVSEEIWNTEKSYGNEIENPDKIKEKEQNEIYDELERFYDADSYQEKLDILMPLRGKLTDVMLTNIAISLDIVAQDGSLDDRFLSIVSCLETMKKYQSNRLR